MTKLLKLELKELFRQFIFRVLLVLCPILGILLGVMNDSANQPVTDSVMQWCGIMSVMLSTYGGLFISREFTRGTIRNKIVVGHRRTHIYLSKLSVVGVIYLVCISLFLLANTLMQVVLSEKITLQWQQLLSTYAGAAICVSLAVTTPIVLRTDMGGLFPLLLLYLSMIFSGLGYEFIDSGIMDTVNLFLPCSLFMIETSTISLPLRVCCSLLEAVLLCVSGCLIFDKADLN